MVLLALGTPGARWHKYINGHCSRLAQEASMKNILFTVFFVELGKKETHSHNARLPFIVIGDAPP
jgi:hypothetical protein